MPGRKSTVKWWVLLVALLLVGIFYVYTQQKQASKVDPSWQIYVADREEIGRVFIAHRDGHTFDLQREQDHWTINSQYKAWPHAIDNLLKTLTSQRIKSLVTNNALPQVTKDIASNSLKVIMYDKEGNELKTLYVGGVTPDERGTFMFIEGAEYPVIADIPGFEGGLRSRYNLTLEDWRDRQLISTSFSELSNITVNYPKQQDESFQLQSRDDGWSITGLHGFGQSPVALKGGDIARFQKTLQSLRIEGFMTNKGLHDSLLQHVPFCELSLTGGQQTSIGKYRFYPRKVLSDVLTPLPIQQYYILSDNGDFMLAQQRLLKELFRSRTGFLYTASN